MKRYIKPAILALILLSTLLLTGCGINQETLLGNPVVAGILVLIVVFFMLKRKKK